MEEERQRLRQAEKAKKEAAKACSAESSRKTSHRFHKEELERYLEGEESPGPQRKKKKARVRSAVVQEDTANKTPSQKNVKTASSKENSSVSNTSKADNSLICENKSATRQQPATTTNHVISNKKTAQSSTTLKPTSNDNSKSKSKEEKIRVLTENSVLAKANGSPAHPTSPKQVAKRSTTKKVSPVNTVMSTASPCSQISASHTTISSGSSPRTTSSQPDKSAQVIANNAQKKGLKKPNGQVQQNNLNNLNGGPQSPMTPARNGLLIQQANCQVNGQKWTLPQKDKVKTPAVSKASGQPVKPPTQPVKVVSRTEPSPPKARPGENGVHHPAEQNLRSGEQVFRNQEQVGHLLHQSKTLPLHAD